jgi:hypothetical protein
VGWWALDNPTVAPEPQFRLDKLLEPVKVGKRVGVRMERRFSFR